MHVLDFVLSCVILGISYLCPAASLAETESIWTQGRQFLRDPHYDDHKIGVPDNLDLIAPSLSRCTSLCSFKAWCTSFFYTASSSKCSLHATVFLDLDSARAAPGARYYRLVVDWCRPQLERQYIRTADMCMYIEMDKGKQVSTQGGANGKCSNMNMGLASNITPLKMEALENITRKNPSINGFVYIGMRRDPPSGGNEDLKWADNQPVDMTALQPFWDSGEPDGSAKGEHCVVIDTKRKSWLTDVACDSSGSFACELLKP